MNSHDVLIIGILGCLLLCLTLVMLCLTTNHNVSVVRVPFSLLIILCICALIGLIVTAAFPSASLTLWWLP